MATWLLNHVAIQCASKPRSEPCGAGALELGNDIPLTALVPPAFAVDVHPAANGAGAPENDLWRITQALRQRPDLTPTTDRG
jgi:hypothetical protein